MAKNVLGLLAKALYTVVKYRFQREVRIALLLRDL